MEILAAAGGSLISDSIESLFEKLRSNELSKFVRKAKLDAELKNLETLLMKIDVLVEDAEQRQTERTMKVWLDELRDLAYDIEDVLDEFSTEALKRRVTKRNSHVRCFFTALSPASLAFKHKMASKMKDITARLQDIATQEQNLNLTRIARKRPNKPKERPPTTSLEESNIYGRNDDKEILVQMLLRHEDGCNPISVIPILGMGGIGKTTLAQLVYNDNNVKTYFDIRVWVCVSENFDVVMLTGRILQSITSEILDLKDFNLLQEKLKEKLTHKKFLLILDDFWEEDYLQWDKLRRPFIAGAVGSKIVITTRKNLVASMAGNVPPYHVKELPDGECLSLLARHALGVENFNSHSSLKGIALDMVKRCKGLPLAAKVLGGLLRNKPSPQEWEIVLRSKMWNLPETSIDAPLPVLKLSYNDLPSYLKRCFVYCAIFPKDYEFDRDKLVLLWMAEGFLHFPQGGKRMEDIGIDYFEDLVSRSFFQASSSWPFFQATSANPKRYVMHDLISDLAQSIGREIYYNYENKIEGSMSNSKFEKVHHASFMFHKANDLQEYGVFTPMKNLRTLLGFPIRDEIYPLESIESLPEQFYNEEFYNLLIQSKKLRVLSLTRQSIKSLPDSIGDLKHLRHLNLSFTRIERLPESISSLFNLLTLLLCYCQSLKKLPDRIGNLVNLRHLDISKTNALQKIPSSIAMLTNLQTLSNFVVNEGHGTTITILKNLNNLRGILSIEGLHNVTNLQDAKSANLKEKQGLEELVFKWNHHHGRNDMSVLESLEPHQNLKRLTIVSYGGSEFLSWVSDPSFSTSLKSLIISGCKNLLSLPDGLMTFDDNTNMCQSHLENLRIFKCEKLTSFPPGKLPATLEHLQIWGCKQMKSISEDMLCNNMALRTIEISGNDKIRVFPSIDCLQSLCYLNISNFYTLESFPEMGLCNLTLEALKIWDCPKLISLPNQTDTHLPSLKALYVSCCPCLLSLTKGGGVLPKSLTTLNISNCENLRQPIVEWGLHRLSSLQSLHLRCICSAVSDVVLFPDDDRCLLATSLQTLQIGDFLNLESLGLGLGRLTNLGYLNIRHCPKLQFLPKEALPSSIRDVRIQDCPLLKEHYLMNKEEYPSSITFEIQQ